MRTPMSLVDAERDLHHVMRSATARLVHLDVARWQPAAAEVLAHQAKAARSPLPATASPRAAQVLETSLRLLSIVEVARADDGAAVSRRRDGVASGGAARHRDRGAAGRRSRLQRAARGLTAQSSPR